MRTFGTRSIRSAVGGDMTSTLLLAALLVPVVSAVLGWPVHTPLDVPLWLHAALVAFVALVVALTASDERSASPTHAWFGWVWLPLLAAAFALVVRERANVFYTDRVLAEGMALLALVDVAVRVLRVRAMSQRDLYVVPARDAGHALGGRWRLEAARRSLPASPAVRLSDRLVGLVGWIVLASWVLIALEHRHVAGPLLLAAGVFDGLALVVLVPEALEVPGWVRRRGAGTGERPTRKQRFVLVRGGTRPSRGIHLLRRHS